MNKSFLPRAFSFTVQYYFNFIEPDWQNPRRITFILTEGQTNFTPSEQQVKKRLAELLWKDKSPVKYEKYQADGFNIIKIVSLKPII